MGSTAIRLLTGSGDFPFARCSPMNHMNYSVKCCYHHLSQTKAGE
jgi:hypothetical protein